MNPFFERRRRGCASIQRLNGEGGSANFHQVGTSPAGADEITMHRAQLASMDRHTVAARLEVDGRPPQVIRGRGQYDQDNELGPVLRILVSDSAGDFELLLLEDEWTGGIESGAELGCDYLVDLNESGASLS